MQNIPWSIVVIAVIFTICSCLPTHSQAQELTPDEARAIAKEAYIYGNPVVDSYRIIHSHFVDKTDPEYKAPFNQIENISRVYTHEDRAVQTPNSDTPYSWLALDLRAEPMVLTVPPIEKERYFSIQLIDLYTHNFEYIGSRTTGNDGGHFLIAGPGWQGDTAENITKVIHCETELMLAVYRTQLFNPDDIEKVKAIQADYNVQALSTFIGEPAPEAAPGIDFIQPLSKEEILSSPKMFSQLNFILQFCPVHPSEQELMTRFAKLNIGAGNTFDWDAFSPDIQEAIGQGIKDAWEDAAELKKQVDAGELSSGDAFGTREHLQNNYLYRMAAAVLGIWGNSEEEAIYPAYYVDADGEKLDGSKRYTLRFAPDQLPPVQAFWSLTMYELPASLLAQNPIDRYLLNSPMLEDFVRDDDGGITLYLQHESPGKDLEPNWLPAPAGPFSAILRLYWPKEDALDGTWTPPALKRTSEPASAAEEGKTPVTLDNLLRAETDHMIRTNITSFGLEIGELDHQRETVDLANQPVIRMNVDTLYSGLLLDLSEPAEVTLPEIDGRYQSMHVINQDHHMFVEAQPGTYDLTEENVGTRFAAVSFRTFVDTNDPEDIDAAHAAQDGIVVSGGGSGPFEAPDWDTEKLAAVRKALNDIAAAISFDSALAYGRKDAVNPVHFLVGGMAGWGGLPAEGAVYLVDAVDQNDGQTPYAVTARDVPVDAFWSITVYNADGYMEPNDLGRNNYNNVSAEPNDDGSITIHLGGCDDGRVNCIPITPGWSYAVRMYQPRQEILDGEWTFPAIEPVK